MVGKKKEKAAPSTAFAARLASEADEESDMPSLSKMQKAELLETTTVDVERVKEALKVKIRG